MVTHNNSKRKTAKEKNSLRTDSARQLGKNLRIVNTIRDKVENNGKWLRYDTTENKKEINDAKHEKRLHKALQEKINNYVNIENRVRKNFVTGRYYKIIPFPSLLFLPSTSV